MRYETFIRTILQLRQLKYLNLKSTEKSQIPLKNNSTNLEFDKFGQLVMGDHLILGKSDELGRDGEKCASIKDNEGACLKCNCKKGKSIVNYKYYIHVLL